MTRIVIKQLVFDVYNLEHIDKHNVTQEEVKKVGKNLSITEKHIRVDIWQ